MSDCLQPGCGWIPVFTGMTISLLSHVHETNNYPRHSRAGGRLAKIEQSGMSDCLQPSCGWIPVFTGTTISLLSRVHETNNYPRHSRAGGNLANGQRRESLFVYNRAVAGFSFSRE